MKVTNVTINKISQYNSNMKGLATIILDDQIAIHNIRIIEGNNGLFIAMPSRKSADDKYYDVVHPITQESREIISTAIIQKYKESEGDK